MPLIGGADVPMSRFPIRRWETDPVPVPEHPMLPHLIELESAYDPGAARTYDPTELLRYAFGTSDYWADLALGWLEQGADREGLVDDLAALETQPNRPQALRHRARRLRKTA
jgi:hypothetical protein